MKPRTITEDGFEQVWQANYLGHFLLTVLLLDILKQSAPSRIVNVSSAAHGYTKKIQFEDINGERKYDHVEIYGQSKLAQILFTNKLAKILVGTGVSAFSVHPGGVKTNLGNSELPRFSKAGMILAVGVSLVNCMGLTAEQGAQTTIYCAVTEGLEAQSGKYFYDCKEQEPKPWAKNDEIGEKLWEFSNEQIKSFV